MTAALNLPADSQDSPQQPIELEFLLAAQGERVTGQVVAWLPYKVAIDAPSLANPADIAILKLDRTPETLTPVTVGEGAWGHQFRILGFPTGVPVGIWASGVLREQMGNGWVSIEDIKAQGRSIEQGFSGAPVWDETLEAVVGMVVQAERPQKNQPNSKVAFMLPVSQLRTVWSRIPGIDIRIDSGVGASPTPPSNPRLRGLQARLKDVSEEIAIGEAQLAATNDDVSRIRLERQLEILYDRYNKIEQQIKNLRVI